MIKKVTIPRSKKFNTRFTINGKNFYLRSRKERALLSMIKNKVYHETDDNFEPTPFTVLNCQTMKRKYFIIKLQDQEQE